MKKHEGTKDILNQLCLRMNNNLQTNTENSTNTGDRGHSYLKDKKHILVVFTGTNVGLEEALDRMVELKNHGFTFDMALSWNGADLLDVDELQRRLQPRNIFAEVDKLKIEEILEDVEGVILPMTTQNTAIKLSLGVQDDFVSTLLWQALWQGKTMMIDFKNVLHYRGQKSKQPVLQQMVEDYVKKLKTMGVKGINHKNYMGEVLSTLAVRGTNPQVTTGRNEGSDSINERGQKVVVTENDVINLSPHEKEIKIPMGSIVTSLAKDAAKRSGIKIIKK